MNLHVTFPFIAFWMCRGGRIQVTDSHCTWRFSQICPCKVRPWFLPIPPVEVVVKRDAEKCWDVVKNMEQQGLPPNNVACPMQRWGQGRAIFLQGVPLVALSLWISHELPFHAVGYMKHAEVTCSILLKGARKHSQDAAVIGDGIW